MGTVPSFCAGERGGAELGQWQASPVDLGLILLFAGRHRSGFGPGKRSETPAQSSQQDGLELGMDGVSGLFF